MSEKAEKIVKVKVPLVTRFVSRTGKNTRDATPNLSQMEYIYFPSELSPDVQAERDDPPAEGQTKPPFVGIDKTHPFGVCIWDMVFGKSADLKSKKFYVKLFRESEPAIYGIAMSVYRLGQRDPVELAQDEEGYKLVDGFVRLVCCTIRDILAEIAQNEPHGTIRRQIVEETKQDDLEDVSIQKNMMRLELKKSDLARRFYEMSLLGREDEAVEPGEEGAEETPAEGETKSKKRKKKLLSDQQIADRCGLPKEGGRQKVFQFRTVYEYCMKQGAKGLTYLQKWDIGKMALKELVEKATAKPAAAGETASTPREKRTTRPRCLSYPAAYRLFNNSDGLAKAIEAMYPEIPIAARLELVRYGLRVAMQQADKALPEAPANEPAPPPAKKGAAAATPDSTDAA